MLTVAICCATSCEAKWHIWVYFVQRKSVCPSVCVYLSGSLTFLVVIHCCLAGNTCIPWNAANLACTNIQESASYHWLCGHGHCDLDLGHMTSGLGHDTLLGNGQQLYEILSRSNLTGRSYGLDLNFDGQKLFSAPEPKAQVHYCDHVLSVVRRPSSVRRR